MGPAWIMSGRQEIMLYNGISFNICDAAIRIGFEKEINRFPEPMLEEDACIYVTKENNVTSEQTFIISFQRTDSVPQGSDFAIAVDEVDYRGISQEFSREFSPHNQRINIPFQLLPDEVPETTKAFQISLSTQGLPAFGSADVLFARTYVVIDDYHSKSIKLNFMSHNYYIAIIIVVSVR